MKCGLYSALNLVTGYPLQASWVKKRVNVTGTSDKEDPQKTRKPEELILNAREIESWDEKEYD
ncbi:phenol 2-monooxygenase [Corchorus olitorius]|uniref:Phenol 2-monooxygenase n=1 Tax=Corchorus olitorius TaxID=93759 RepID=A0A1R3L0P2_9ROSI|nr:phenol 2-monooxygenase [Corchorus olitorius]